MRNIINFNTDWYFNKTNEVPAQMPAHWEKVALPHTWNAIDGQDGGNDYWRGTATYAKAFGRPELEENGRAVLEFPGAAMTADVYVNGQHLAHHEGGYSTFRVDITDAVQEENLLCVAVDNGENDHVYPQKADFTFYGGLYRGVNLITVSDSHFELCKDGTPGIKVTPVVDGDSALVTVEVWTNGRAERVRMEVDGHFMDAEVAQDKTEAVFKIKNVHLWDGLKDPYLYTAAAVLYEGEEEKDRVSVRFGCRTISFDPEKGFLLNGRSYPLRGVSRHQDREGVGNALTLQMHEEDMEIIREIGANTVRLAHYQHAQEFYDLCDENGLIVWAEIPYITQHMENGRQNTIDQMRELVTQCYNHPSIVCWGLSNEITASGTATEDLMENHRLLNDLCHKMDATRPTTMAHVFMLETDSPLVKVPDIGSYNLYFGWYLGELAQNDSFFDEYHGKFPDRVIGFSEYGADANPQFQSAASERGDYSESYQCIYHEHILDCIEKRPYLWATHVWNLFDFAADGRDEGGKHGVNQKGLVTMDRKLKKDAFYLYKAAWSREPFVHLCGSRYADRAEEMTEIKVYSNLLEVALYQDGKLLEKRSGKRVFVFKAPVTGEHTITAKASADTGVIPVCTDEMKIRKVETPNKAYCFAQEGGIVNWFDKDDFKEGYFSIKDTLGSLMAHPQTGAIVGRLMEQAQASRGDVAKSTAGNKNLEKMMAGMSLESLLKQAGDAVSPEQIKALNAALQKIGKEEQRQSDRKVYHIDMRIGQILDNESAAAIFDHFLPGMKERVESQPMTAGMSVRKLAEYSNGAITDSVLEAMNAELNKIPVDNAENSIKEQIAALKGQPLTRAAAEQTCQPKQTAVYPGRPWRDTCGRRIQAHGGALFYEDGTYYWYGENKDRTDGKSSIWTWGIRAYASEDLYNWEDLGLIIEPDLESPDSNLFPTAHVDRPHILKCEKTGKYVCWIKLSGDEACFIVLQADAFRGPYSMVAENYRPFGRKAGDFDIVKEESGKAYLFMDADHKGILGMELSEDFLTVKKEISRQYEGLHAPFCREGVTLFERGGKKYMLTSGMSGYIPNKSDAAVADSWTNAFVSIGNPHVEDASNASFNSQISQVFKVPGKKELYISIADRWVPGYPVDAARADMIERAIAAHYEPDKYQVSPEEQKELMGSPMLESADTSAADYVWLPLAFDGDRVCIRWEDEWKTEDYE